MDRFDDDTLFAELRALRPTPRPEFAAELDERAAAGFPRGADTTASVFAPVIDWWRASSPVWRLAPAFAIVLVALVVTTAVISTHGGKTTGAGEGAATSAPSFSAGQATSEGAAGSEEEATGGEEAAEAEGVEMGESAGEENGSVEAESAPAEAEGTKKHAGALPAAPPAVEAAPDEKGLSTARGRDIERSAYVVLGTKPGGVSAAAAKVFTAVHAAHGIVLHSSVQSGSKGATGASFSLLIPSRKVDDALAEISGIAEVRARHDATNDITAPTVSAAEELADSNASIESLLKELGDAETESERESLETRLHEERRRHATIRGSLAHLHERASMSEVSVRIVTGNGAGVAPPAKGSGGSWGVGDALGDAGDILTVAAGVALIGLAILGPLAILAILLWGGNRFRVRRLRERTLG